MPQSQEARTYVITPDTPKEIFGRLKRRLGARLWDRLVVNPPNEWPRLVLVRYTDDALAAKVLPLTSGLVEDAPELAEPPSVRRPSRTRRGRAASTRAQRASGESSVLLFPLK